MDELLELLEEIKPDVDFETATDLIEDEILDSFDIVTIVAEINSTFGIDFPVAEIVPENFESAQAIYKVIEELLDE